eukprot:s8_g38.t3
MGSSTLDDPTVIRTWDVEVKYRHGSAICLYLLQMFDKEGKLAPMNQPDFAALLYQLAFYCSGTVDNLTATSSPIQPVMSVKNPGDDERVLEVNHRAWIEQCGPLLVSNLGSSKYIAGDSFTAIDVIVGVNMHYIHRKISWHDFPVLEAYFERLKERTAFQEAFEDTCLFEPTTTALSASIGACRGHWALGIFIIWDRDEMVCGYTQTHAFAKGKSSDQHSGVAMASPIPINISNSHFAMEFKELKASDSMPAVPPLGGRHAAASLCGNFSPAMTPKAGHGRSKTPLKLHAVRRFHFAADLDMGDIFQYTMLMKSEGKMTQWINVLELFEHMLSCQIRADSMCCHTVLRSVRPWQLALSFSRSTLRHMIQPDVFSCNAALELQKSQWQRCLEVLQQMSPARLLPDVISYTCVSNAVGSAHTWPQVLNLLVAMELVTIPLDVVHYTAAFSSAIPWSLLLHLLEKMFDGEVKPDVINYNSVLHACEEASQWQLCLYFLRDMCNLEVTPDVITYSTVVTSTIYASLTTQLPSLLQAMRRASVQPNAILVTSALTAFQEQDSQWHMGLQFLDDIHAFGVTLDIMNYVAGISACSWTAPGAQGPWQRALHFLKEIVGASFRRSAICYNAAVTCCHRAEQWPQSLQLWTSMWSRGILPDTVTVSSTISVHSCGSQWWMSSALTETLQSQKLLPDLVFYNTILASATWLLALQLLDPPTGILETPDTVSFNASMNACAKAGEWQVALHLFEQMKSRSIVPDVFSYSSIMASCEWRLALAFLQQMQSEKLSPDLPCFNALLASCHRSSESTLMMQLFSKMFSMRLNPDSSSRREVMGYRPYIRYPKVLAVLPSFVQLHHGHPAADELSDVCGNDWAVNFDAWTLQKLNAISATSTLCSMDGAAGVWPRALCVYEQTEEADVVTLAATLGICAQGSQHGADNAAWCCAWHLLELAQRQREDLVALSPACTSLTSSASRAKQWRLALESLALGR